MAPKQTEGGEKNEYKIITDRDKNQPTELPDVVFASLMIKNNRFKPLCAFFLLKRQQYSKLI